MNDLNHSRNVALLRRAGYRHGLFLQPVLVAVLGVVLAGRATAQTFTNLYSFTASERASLRMILSGNMLYGATTGTVFAVSIDGSGFTNLHSFTDGARPSTQLILSGNTLYGMTSGGSSSNGSVFKVNTDGTGFTTLHHFTASIPYYTNDYGTVISTNSDGASPVFPTTAGRGGLILSNNTLYGTAGDGGVWGSGTAFALNTDGTGFTNLHQFTSLTAYQVSTDPVRFINSDGAHPGGLILSGQLLYGATYSGGDGGEGTVFALSTDGTGFTNLYNFPHIGGLIPSVNSHSDVILLGDSLYAADDGTVVAINTDSSGSTRTLYTGPSSYVSILSAGTLYGGTYEPPCPTCPGGGSGMVFKVNTDGSGFTTLYSFNTEPGDLILSGDTLYGTAGMVFAVKTDGTDFTTLHAFTGISPNSSGVYTNSDGVGPFGLILSGNTLYGTASGGGSFGNGTVFGISFRPQLAIVPAGTNVVLSWPTNFAGFDYTGYTLQSTTNPNPSAIWSTNLPPPVVVNGQLTVTNPLSGTQQFFRLTQ